ncbi:hypothetical protein ABI59_08470 [Acidobacteria bacterium Mor1]|nr:hypothetical protein ABI59_08470 [Acidobacteria bacterium Mor1]
MIGHKPDPCGVCLRCGSAKGSTHQWEPAEREKPCYRREVCSVCAKEREQPEHDWDFQEVGMVCSRCGLRV